MRFVGHVHLYSFVKFLPYDKADWVDNPYCEVRDNTILRLFREFKVLTGTLRIFCGLSDIWYRFIGTLRKFHGYTVYGGTRRSSAVLCECSVDFAVLTGTQRYSAHVSRTLSGSICTFREYRGMQRFSMYVSWVLRQLVVLYACSAGIMIFSRSLHIFRGYSITLQCSTYVLWL